MKPSWAEKKVIEMAGIPIEEADDMIISRARVALERCYYLDRAAEELVYILCGPFKR